MTPIFSNIALRHKEYCFLYQPNSTASKPPWINDNFINNTFHDPYARDNIITQIANRYCNKSHRTIPRPMCTMMSFNYRPSTLVTCNTYLALLTPNVRPSILKCSFTRYGRELVAGRSKISYLHANPASACSTWRTAGDHHGHRISGFMNCKTAIGVR